MQTTRTPITPGPWRTAEGKELDRHPNEQPDIVMGGIGFRLVPIDGCGMLTRQIKANARLMAQAPELLEALQALVPIGWNDSPLCKVYTREIQAAERAIAKATEE